MVTIPSQEGEIRSIPRPLRKVQFVKRDQSAITEGIDMEVGQPNFLAGDERALNLGGAVVAANMDVMTGVDIAPAPIGRKPERIRQRNHAYKDRRRNRR